MLFDFIESLLLSNAIFFFFLYSMENKTYSSSVVSSRQIYFSLKTLCPIYFFAAFYYDMFQRYLKVDRIMQTTTIHLEDSAVVQFTIFALCMYVCMHTCTSMYKIF